MMAYSRLPMQGWFGQRHQAVPGVLNSLCLPANLVVSPLHFTQPLCGA